MSRAALIAATLFCAAALAAPAQVAPDLGTEAQRAAGKIVYEKYCSQCHGENGDGLGPARARLKPWPRDLTSGKYKFRTTPSGSMPTTADLERVVRMGIPYTSMPAFPSGHLSDKEVRNVVYYVKSFSDRFADPEYLSEPIAISAPPAMTEESIARGRQVYEEIGCIKCHGDGGLGNGLSAATLKDDWGQHIRPADMSARWTFRGGPSRTDIYRAFSTGLNGTPMPSYYDSLSEEDRWHLTNYIYSIGDGDDPAYDTLVVAKPVDRELDLAEGAVLFEGAEPARFPLVGQIMEPGRSFYPATSAVVVRAVYNRDDVALMVRWHDMLADTAGTNDPTLEVPAWDEQQHHSLDAEPQAAAADADPWGEAAAADADPWGEAAVADPWGDDEAAAAEEGGEGGIPTSEFSDAVAIQLPVQIPEGIRKPYFLLGDVENPVDLWFVDVARPGVRQFEGRGGNAVVPADADELEAAVSYDDGAWTLVVKRPLKSRKNVTFKEKAFVPVAFSTWDGFQRERGNKRSLTQWVYLYMEPREAPSAVGPMVKGALIAIVIEVVLLVWLRRRFSREAPAASSDREMIASAPAAGRAGS